MTAFIRGVKGHLTSQNHSHHGPDIVQVSAPYKHAIEPESLHLHAREHA